MHTCKLCNKLHCKALLLVLFLSPQILMQAGGFILNLYAVQWNSMTSL